MAATPMAIPRAESPARNFRVRRPTVESRARSESCSPGAGRRSIMAPHAGRAPVTVARARVSRRPRLTAALAGRGRDGVGDDAAVEDLDFAGHRSAMARSWVMTTMVEPAWWSWSIRPGSTGRWPGRGCRSARRRARCRLADEGAGDGDPLALPAGELGRSGVGAAPRPTSRARRRRARSRRSARGSRRRGGPSATLSARRKVLGEEELLEDEPDPGGPKGRDSRRPWSRRRVPVSRGPGRVGRSSVPMSCRGVVLPDPRGRRSRPAPRPRMRRLTPTRAPRPAGRSDRPSSPPRVRGRPRRRRPRSARATVLPARRSWERRDGGHEPGTRRPGQPRRRRRRSRATPRRDGARPSARASSTAYPPPEEHEELQQHDRDN